MVVEDEEDRPWLLLATLHGVKLEAIGHGDNKGGQRMEPGSDVEAPCCAPPHSVLIPPVLQHVAVRKLDYVKSPELKRPPPPASAHSPVPDPAWSRPSLRASRGLP
jgi:hypothetical protein